MQFPMPDFVADGVTTCGGSEIILVKSLVQQAGNWTGSHDSSAAAVDITPPIPYTAGAPLLP